MREYFVHLVPVYGPGSWVIAKFSRFTQIEDFNKKIYPWEAPDVLQNHKLCTFAKNIVSRKV